MLVSVLVSMTTWKSSNRIASFNKVNTYIIIKYLSSYLIVGIDMKKHDNQLFGTSKYQHLKIIFSYLTKAD